ncbi:dialkylresorcinol condensing enzyme DarA [Flavobacterium sp. xlx-214]|uniref:dialkylrecorsinol condensing enzyme DarA n=1 Tax=unclassified Flavobacterium TaxID=196869 RepID=UPI0013CFC01D|nr:MULTISPECIES: dialkylrecorsinol condensing enzyme DarA [unclassified Flavobacterium]MBA5792115.1 dialkylresorcinol condensing enzyme DarA [Flavobacterium sp. xlx-221]QMI84362.1 dialkylresorcinol condensing enzyme DarA [Flavobacterium sp. xlx-214]
MKNVLVIYYSQSGQLKEIAENISLPLKEKANITYYNIETEEKFPFPWDNASFFGAFPETFKQIPSKIIPPKDEILNAKYDLVLLHYQVWYLTPSIPINSFLKSSFAQQLLQNTPVITISGSRNMWAFAQEKVKKLLKNVNANLVGNIALTDRNINLISVITVVDWMFSGVKRKTYGFLPLPGVSQQEIQESSKFGNIILPFLLKGNFTQLQEKLVESNAVEYRWFLVSMDKKANKMFTIWSSLILKNPNKRELLLKFFKGYLFCAIWILSPIVHLIELILFPIRYFSIRKEKKYFQGVL